MEDECACGQPAAMLTLVLVPFEALYRLIRKAYYVLARRNAA